MASTKALALGKTVASQYHELFIKKQLTHQIRYIHSGNSKFGSITIEQDPDNSDKSALSYQLFVDGVVAWNATIQTPERSPGAKTAGGLWERLKGSR